MRAETDGGGGKDRERVSVRHWTTGDWSELCELCQKGSRNGHPCCVPVPVGMPAMVLQYHWKALVGIFLPTIGHPIPRALQPMHLLDTEKCVDGWISDWDEVPVQA